MAVATDKAFADAIPSHMAKSFHKLPARPGLSERIFMIYDHPNKDPYSFTCLALNKVTGGTTEWTISPAPDTKRHNAILLNFTAVALGSTIYMIGGRCRLGFCPDRVIGGCHRHVEIRFFDALRPEDGWREAAPMHIARLKPAAAVIDGMIYVFGGSGLEAPQDGECFDPNTNEWLRFSAMGCRPAFACIQVPYMDPNGAKSVLIHSDYQNVETLFAYLPGTQKWEIVSHDFGKCHRPGAFLGILGKLKRN